MRTREQLLIDFTVYMEGPKDKTFGINHKEACTIAEWYLSRISGNHFPTIRDSGSAICNALNYLDALYRSTEERYANT